MVVVPDRAVFAPSPSSAANRAATDRWFPRQTAAAVFQRRLWPKVLPALPPTTATPAKPSMYDVAKLRPSQWKTFSRSHRVAPDWKPVGNLDCLRIGVNYGFKAPMFNDYREAHLLAGSRRILCKICAERRLFCNSPNKSGACWLTICEPISAMKMSLMRTETGYPHPLPHTGRGNDCQSPCVYNGFVAVLNFVLSPTSVGFMARAALFHLNGCRARQKPPSSLTRPPRVHPRTGYV